MESGLYAGFWRRTAAYAIDGLVLLAPAWIIGYVLRDNPVLVFIGQAVLYWLYTAFLESGALQATLGKKLFGTKVTDVQGERISFMRASGRYFAMFVSALILGIGFLMAAFTAKKQALHDIMAGCLVLRSQASREEVQAGGSTMPVTGGVWAVVGLIFIFPFFGGMLAAIAIPAYQDYTIRAKVDAAMTSAGPMRDPPARSPYVREVNGGKSSGRIDILLETQAFGRALQEGAAITYTARGDGTWACTARAIPMKYLPQACRDSASDPVWAKPSSR
jgi:Predicted membrane protein/domain